MPQQYTVKNNETGQSITFDWHDATPPTDADIEEVFAAAGQQQQGPEISTEKFMEARMPKNELGPALSSAFGWIKRNPGSAGAMAAGLAAAPFTGGMSVPAMMAAEGVAAGAGHALGAVIGKGAQGQEINPSEIATDATKEGVFGGLTAGAGPTLKGLAKGAYQLALKPRLPYGMEVEDVARLVQTGLDEGINVSAGGFRKAGKLIGQEANEVRKLVAGLDATADVRRGLEKIAALRQRWMKSGVLDEKIAALDDVADQYLQRYSGDMPLEELHSLKQGIWHETQNNWDKSLNPAKIEAQKAFGSGLREEIEQVGKARGVHDIGTRNERIGRLGELQDAVSGRAGHEAMPGLRQGVEMLGGATPGALTRALMLSSPALSTGARVLNTAGKFLDPRTFAPAPSHLITDERRLLGPAPTPLGPAPDPSFVKGVPAPPSPRPIRGYLPEPTPVHSMGPVPSESYARGIPGEKTPWTLDQVGVPGPQGAMPSDMLDRLDIPVGREMPSPEQLWIKKQLLKMDPRLERLGEREWARLIKETVESGAYKGGVEKPGVKITKDRVEELYRRYLAAQ